MQLVFSGRTKGPSYASALIIYLRINGTTHCRRGQLILKRLFMQLWFAIIVIASRVNLQIMLRRGSYAWIKR